MDKVDFSVYAYSSNSCGNIAHYCTSHTIRTFLKEFNNGNNEYKKLAEKAIEDRRHLHQYPEASGEEYETSEFIRKRLEELDIEILDYEPPCSGVYKRDKGNKNYCITCRYRCLTYKRRGDKPYISDRQGVAHMCGHDGHTAILLAVATWISLNREKIEPNIKLIFQSAEEITPSGADLLIQKVCWKI